MSSSQVTFIFFRGVGIPPTSFNRGINRGIHPENRGIHRERGIRHELTMG
jgi:hypothetical protein